MPKCTCGCNKDLSKHQIECHLKNGLHLTFTEQVLLKVDLASAPWEPTSVSMHVEQHVNCDSLIIPSAWKPSPHPSLHSIHLSIDNQMALPILEDNLSVQLDSFTTEVDNQYNVDHVLAPWDWVQYDEIMDSQPNDVRGQPSWSLISVQSLVKSIIISVIISVIVSLIIYAWFWIRSPILSLVNSAIISMTVPMIVSVIVSLIISVWSPVNQLCDQLCDQLHGLNSDIAKTQDPGLGLQETMAKDRRIIHSLIIQCHTTCM